MALRNVMISKIKAINYEKLDKLATDIAKRNNKSKTYVKLDMIKNFLQYGIGYTDYLKGDYINLTKEQKKTFVTTKSFYKLLKYLNKETYIATMSDKLVFNKIFKKYLGREFIDLRTTSISEFKNFIKNKKVIFAKPPTDFGGHGIEKIVLKNEKNIDKLYNDLKKKKLILIEDEIVQHEELNKLNPYAVNSFRIVTLVKDNKAYIIGNALRINIDDAIAIGCSDAYMRLSEDGTISSRVIDDVANIYEEHPIKKIKFNTVKVPYVKEAFDMALEAALVVPEIRYVGWDIAITKDGPVIMEGNEYPSYGLVQYYLFNDEHEGHLKQIADILGDEMDKIKL
ncbi:MAG: sugar-transfer associated ATP-grasp domain-containing protein [bacterium]|nr:sugar-transfer associated ATP-grasp domain-containing protein [bacterium]